MRAQGLQASPGTMKARAPRFTVKEVTRSTWRDFEKLFESPGGPSYCWCMAWRASATERKNADSAARKRAIKRRVDEGMPVGLLGYLDDEPVAWCSVAPSTTYRRLRSDEEPGDEVWSIVCFFIRREHRGKGLARLLLEAAARHAGKHGATVVEGYPVERTSPSYRHMGFVSMFRDAGFREVAREGARRIVVRRETGRNRG